MTLDEAPTGQPVVVRAGPAAPAPAPARPGDRRADRGVPNRAIARRLAELGFRAGTTLHVLTRTSGGGAIVAVGDDRIAVSREILRAIPIAPSAEGVATGG